MHLVLVMVATFGAINDLSYHIICELLNRHGALVLLVTMVSHQPEITQQTLGIPSSKRVQLKMRHHLRLGFALGRQAVSQ